MKKEEKGITLVALVVTIIVLLILAGIAISLTIGNNGLFGRAQNAADTWRRAEVNEQKEMSNFEELYDETTNNLGLNSSNEENQLIYFTLDGHELSCKEGSTWSDDAVYEQLLFDTYRCCSDMVHLVWYDYSTFNGGAQPMQAKTILCNGEKVKVNDKILNGGVYKRNDVYDDEAYQ